MRYSIIAQPSSPRPGGSPTLSEPVQPVKLEGPSNTTPAGSPEPVPVPDIKLGGPTQPAPLGSQLAQPPAMPLEQVGNTVAILTITGLALLALLLIYALLKKRASMLQ